MLIISGATLALGFLAGPSPRAAARAPARTACAPRLCTPAPYEAAVGPLPGALGDSLPLLIGPVATGFGRGSRKLGIPTANLPCSLFQEQLVDLPCGVYAGWTGLRGGVHKCVCNIGFSPTFEGAENPEKIVEAHIMEEFDEDFYGEMMSLLLLGFLRPERKFGGLDELLATIHADIACASEALAKPPYAELQVLVAALPVLPGNKASFTLLDVPGGLLDGLDAGAEGVARESARADAVAEADAEAFGSAPGGFDWGGLF